MSAAFLPFGKEEAAHDPTAERIRREKRTVILIGVLLIVGPILWGIWTNNVNLSQVQVLSATDLCPGEQLIFSYHLATRGDGVFVRDVTTWRVSPPKTVIFSEERRFILESAIDQDLREAWEVPEVYFNYENWSEGPLAPGDYVRFISVSSTTNSIASDIEKVSFRIREGCPGG